LGHSWLGKIQIDNDPVSVIDGLGNSHYKGAHIALVVFDITSRPSFDAVERWAREVRAMASPSCLLVLVGNKGDLEEEREVTTEDAKEYADRNGMMYYETSALWD